MSAVVGCEGSFLAAGALSILGLAAGAGAVAVMTTSEQRRAGMEIDGGGLALEGGCGRLSTKQLLPAQPLPPHRTSDPSIFASIFAETEKKEAIGTFVPVPALVPA
jgi:hypothetical protein